MLGGKRAEESAQRSKGIATARDQASPPHDALSALALSAARLDRLIGTDEMSPGRALDLIEQIDRARAQDISVLCRQQISGRHPENSASIHLAWHRIDEYLAKLVRGYRWCLDKCETAPAVTSQRGPLLALVAALGIRACGLRMKVGYVHYQPVEATLWGDLLAFQRVCATSGVAREEVVVHSSDAASGCVEQEFLKAVALALSSPAGLLPAQIETAQALIELCSPQFVLVEGAIGSAHHFIDPANPTDPQRALASFEIPAEAWGIDLSGAISGLKRVAHDLEHGAIAFADLNLDVEPDLELVTSTVRHLLRYWDHPRERRHSRWLEVSRIDVVHDFYQVASKVVGIDPTAPTPGEPESWLTKERSEFGLLAVVSHPRGKWAGVGSLLAYRYENLPVWYAGIVRRVQWEDDETRVLAVERLAAATSPVLVSPRFNVDAAAPVPAIFLVDASFSSGELVSLLLPSGVFEPTSPLEMRARQDAYLLFPQELLESGQGYQIARFKLLKSPAAGGR